MTDPGRPHPEIRRFLRFAEDKITEISADRTGRLPFQARTGRRVIDWLIAQLKDYGGK